MPSIAGNVNVGPRRVDAASPVRAEVASPPTESPADAFSPSAATVAPPPPAAAVPGSVRWSAQPSGPWFTREALGPAPGSAAEREDADALWTLLHAPQAGGWRSAEELIAGVAKLSSRWSWMGTPASVARLAAAARSTPELALALVRDIPAEVEKLAPAVLASPEFLQRFATEASADAAQRLPPQPGEPPEVSIALARKGRPVPPALHGERALLLSAAQAGAPLRALGPLAAEDAEIVAAAVERDPLALGDAAPALQGGPLQERARALLLAAPSLQLTAERFARLPAALRDAVGPALAPLAPGILSQLTDPAPAQDALAAALLEGRVALAHEAWSALRPEQQQSKPILEALLRAAPGAYVTLPWELQADKALAMTYLAHYETRYTDVVGEGEWVPLFLLPPELQADPEVAALAVQQDARSFQAVGDAQRDDAALARAAVAQDGLQLEFASERLRDDAPTVRRAVQENGRALAFASERLRADPELVREAMHSARPHAEQADAVVDVAAAVPDGALDGLGAIARASRGADFKALSAAVPAWSESADTLALVLRFFPPAKVWEALTPEAQPRFFEAATRLLQQDDGSARALWDGLPDAARAALEPVAARNPRLYEGEPPLRTAPPRPDAQTARALLATLRDEALLPLVRSNRELFLQDKALRASAVLRDADVALWLARGEGDPPPLQDWDLLVEAAEVNPLILASLGPWNREQLLSHAEAKGVRAKVEQRCLELERRLQEVDIEFPERVGRNWLLLQELLVNRTTTDAQDPRPLTVVIGPKRDFSGALGSNDLETLTRHTRVVYYEAGLDSDAVTRLREATRHQPAQLVVFMGHADRERAALGAEDPARGAATGGQSDASLDVQDSALLALAGVRGSIAPGGHVVLVACSVGRGGRDALNLENVLAGNVPQAHLWGNRTLVTPPRFVFDGAELRDVDYGKRPGLTLHLGPRA